MWLVVVARIVILISLGVLHVPVSPTAVAHSQITWVVYIALILGVIAWADRATTITVDHSEGIPGDGRAGG